MSSPAPHPPTDRTVLLVGGVPGAGKSTAIGRATRGRDDVDVVDSDTVRRRLRSRLPAGLTYRRYRWLVHTITAAWMAWALVRGPRSGRRLLVHDPATRPRRRQWFVRLAGLRGWRPTLVFVDVGRADALRGQRERGRVVRPEAFDRHWTRWLELRRRVIDAPDRVDGGRWQRVLLVDRAAAATELHALLTRGGALTTRRSSRQRRPHSGAPSAWPGLPMPTCRSPEPSMLMTQT